MGSPEDVEQAPDEPAVAAPVPAGSSAVETDAQVRWHYTVRPSADLKTLSARVCFSGRVPERFDAQMPASRWSLISAHRHPGGQPLSQRVDGLDISALQPGDCLEYSLDLASVASRLENERRMRRVGEDWYISPDYWLWKPIGGRDQATLTAAFDNPDGVSLSMPWPYFQRSKNPADDIYRIPESTFTWLIPGALGHFPTDYIDIGDTRIRVAMLGGKWQKRERLLKWLTDAAGAVALLGGGIPIEAVQVILLPTPGKRIGFGFATHGGGGTVVIFVGRQISEKNLAKDWVAVHELLHLGMPMLTDESRWLSEGLSTYYEPFLRAKVGLTTVTDVWEQMHDGFRRGRRQESERTLRDDCVKMQETHAYQRVYWSGAAIALIADVAARQDGSSLDREIQAIRECCLHATAILSADELMARVDGNGARLTPYLHSAAQPHLNSAVFPDVTAAYDALGLSFDAQGRVSLSSDPAQKALRERLTGPETPTGD